MAGSSEMRRCCDESVKALTSRMNCVIMTQRNMKIDEDINDKN